MHRIHYRFGIVLLLILATVTFTLEPAGKGTRLSVAETGFTEISLARRAKVFQDNTQGWTEVIVWIQKYAEAQG